MFNIEYDLIDEINIGEGTKLRLVENIQTKRRVIQSYSSLSKQWNVLYRYEIEKAWLNWKQIESRWKANKNGSTGKGRNCKGTRKGSLQ